MLRALRHGISLRDTTVYCTMVPCFTCAKLMVGVGVYRVVALHNYHDSENTRQLFLDADVALCTMSFSPLYDPHQQDNSNEECVVARTSVPDTVATVNRDMICPRHNVTFSTVEKSVNGVRICPHGETWILRYGVFINVDELESGEAINL